MFSYINMWGWSSCGRLVRLLSVDSGAAEGGAVAAAGVPHNASFSRMIEARRVGAQASRSQHHGVGIVVVGVQYCY